MNNFLIENKIKKTLKKNESRQKIFRNLKKIRTILVLLDTEDYEEVDVFIDHLERMGKKVISYAYKNKKDEYDYSETPYIIIDHREISGIFKNKLEKIVAEVKKMHYDALFDMTIRKTPAIEYVAASANAYLKVGCKKNCQQIYDFTICPIKNSNEDSFNTRELGKQILHYLSTIRSI
ncbi:MAG: hypothetical protein LBH32_12700 [Dysgonamonadaceae bacterium]|jgi:hypothetical protein|nr:hypothetical protein [Dysgonamonadaceae bacterium]